MTSFDAIFNVGLKYAVFGLGNKTYEHFNAMAKFVDKKLEELGGERVHVMGLGDDDANLVNVHKVSTCGIGVAER